LKPFAEMKKLNSTKETAEQSGVPYYRIYSAHDYQIANIMIQIDPTFILDVVPYASTVMFELYKKGNGYFVKTIYNGQTLKFDQCDN
jgi:hypothetical protein